jgi:sec-independent protein translocase protein TatA
MGGAVKEKEMVESAQYTMALWTPQGLDWLWILLIILVIFGGKKLPELARSIGKGLSQFKKGLRDVEDEVEKTKKEIDKTGDSAAGPKDSQKSE